MNRNRSSRYLFTITCSVAALGLCLPQAFAQKTKATPRLQNITSVNSNPMGRRDVYTINSNIERKITVRCVFVNSGSKPAALNVWLTPKSLKPDATVLLEAGSKVKPFQLKEKYSFELKPKWWCRIYTPHNQKDAWKNCAYFSVSDATVVEDNPFATWPKTSHSTDTSYHCQIVKPRGRLSFFYFK